ncbi:Protein FAR1-RELATED SEQUENCE 9 [Bienertia sinuspersici]
MSYHSEFRHDSDSRFAIQLKENVDVDNDDEGDECEVFVNRDEGFIEDFESELLYKKVKFDQEAYELYNNYSFKHGFGTRKGKIERRADRVTIRQRIITFRYASFKRVKKYGEEPKVSGEQVAMLNSLIENGIGVANAVRVLKNQVGGKANLGFLCSDAYNVLGGEKRKKLHVTHGLCDFYNSFIDVVDEWRGKEGNHDYNIITGNRHLVWADIRLLEHARKVYTIALYLMFEENFIRGVPYIVIITAKQPLLFEYHVGHPKRDLIMHTITFDESMVTVDCTCKYFGEVGLLCKHSLRVLHLNNITYIPSKYIVKIWTKGAMCTRVDDLALAHHGIAPPSVWRLDNIRKFTRIVGRAQYDMRARNIIEECIDECTSGINLFLEQDHENVVQEFVDNEQDEAVENQEDGNLLEQAAFEEHAETEVVIRNQHTKDPIKRRKKGQKNSRLKRT